MKSLLIAITVALTTAACWAEELPIVGAVEFQFTAADRTVHTHIVRLSEPVSAELPGDLAVAAGRLLRRLAQEGLTRVARER